MAEESDEKTLTYVQVRLPKALSDTLKAAAARSNRKLPSEILHRLQAEVSGGGPAEALVYGWVDAERNEVLGAALGMLAGRLEVAGPMTEDRVRDRAGVLAMLKIAVADVLDRMGADESSLSADEKNFAALKAREFANDLMRPQRGPHSIGPRPDLEILAKVASGEPMLPPKVGGG